MSKRRKINLIVSDSFFQAVGVSILLYGCTTWMLTKRMEKRFDSNYTRMLREKVLEATPIKKTIRDRRTRHAEHYWLGTPSHG